MDIQSETRISEPTIAVSNLKNGPTMIVKLEVPQKSKRKLKLILDRVGHEFEVRATIFELDVHDTSSRNQGEVSRPSTKHERRFETKAYDT